MKKNFVCFLWIWIVVSSLIHPSLASDIIWTENFSTDENVGCAHDGTSSPGSGKWNTDCAGTALTDANDYFKVVSGQFEGRDLEGEAIWTSVSIDISAFKDVFFSVDLSHTDLMEAGDYIEVYYQIDGGTEQLSIAQTGSFSAFTHTESGLNGDYLTLIIKVNNNADLEKHRFDNIIVEGTPVNQLAACSFENTGDTWNYAVFPATYNTETTGDPLIVNGDEDVWAAIKAFYGKIEPPAHKSQFWGMQDLNNNDVGSGGGNFYHYLEFDPIDISGHQNVTLSFQYYTIGLDNGDEIEYIVEYNNGSTWGAATALDKNTGSWTTISVNVPDDKDMIRLRLQAKQNGNDDFAGWDNIRLTGEAMILTHYYTTASNNLEQTTQWNDGLGGQPADFTAANQIFHILTDGDATIGESWTVSGSNSRLIVGDGNTATNFIIPSNYTFNGKADVKDGAMLTLENSTAPELGFLSENSTVAYSRSSGVSNQEIYPAVYGHLILKNSSPTKAFIGDITVLGNMFLDNVILSANTATDLFLGGNLSLTGTVNFNANIQTNLDIVANGEGLQAFTGSASTGTIQLKSLTLEKVAGSISVADAPATTIALAHDLILDYYNIASFTELNQISIGRNLVINGNVSQPIEAGTYQGITLETLGDASLGGDVTITNTLKLTAGNLLLGDYNLTLGSGGNIQGGNAASYIVTKDDKASGGFLSRETPNNETEITFPVGTPDSYTPCYVTNASVGNTETFIVRVFNDVFENGTSGSAVNDLENLVKKTWEISPIYETGANITLRFQWNGSNQGSTFDEDFVHVIKYQESWKAISEKHPPIESSGVYTTSVTGITEFSKFTIGGESATLPVIWLSFTANEENGLILLSWKTATEINNRGFEIQRSSDGKEYQTIGFVQGAGNSNQIQEYSYRDDPGGKQNSFYRLKQVDYDGKLTYSKTVFISGQYTESLFFVYPNPTPGQVQLRNSASSSEPYYLQLFKTDGTLVVDIEGTIEKLNRHLNKYLSFLPAGVYPLKIIENSEVFSLKLIKND